MEKKIKKILIVLLFSFALAQEEILLERIHDALASLAARIRKNEKAF